MYIEKLTILEKIKISIPYIIGIIDMSAIDVVFFVGGKEIFMKSCTEDASTLRVLALIFGLGTTVSCVCAVSIIILLAIRHVIKVWSGRLVKMIINDEDFYIVDKKDVTYEK